MSRSFLLATGIGVALLAAAPALGEDAPFFGCTGSSCKEVESAQERDEIKERHRCGTNAECAAKGGEYVPLGFAAKCGCRLRTGDAGKLCKDSSECESGRCIREASDGKELVGRCTGWTAPRGGECGVIENGREYCID